MVAVSAGPQYTMAKANRPRIELVEGLGVLGDIHAGATVKHRSRMRRDPTQPNLRQVHLLAAELLEELAGSGFDVPAGRLGENVTTHDVDLLALSTGTVLHLGPVARIEITGLRNPCAQIDGVQHGMLRQVLYRDAGGAVVRRAGVMAVVLAGGPVVPGDGIGIVAPEGPHRPLLPV